MKRYWEETLTLVCAFWAAISLVAVAAIPVWLWCDRHEWLSAATTVPLFLNLSVAVHLLNLRIEAGK